VVLTAVLVAAAVLHAGWNAIAKASGDRLGLFGRAAVVSFVLASVLCVLTPLPYAAAWPWLVASALVHTFYNLGLMAAYQLGDFNQTYPLARGLGPLIVAVVAATFLGEPLPLLPAAGVVIIAVAIGVLGLTPWQRLAQNRRAVLAAVLTGLAIATYTLLDGVGVRRSGSPIGYLAWLIALHCGTMILVALALRKRRPSTSEGRAGWGVGLIAGVMSMSAYGLVLWAQAHGALAAIAALRESSVVVAAILGVLLFREPMGRLRIAASVAVVAGVVLLAVPSGGH
jgi:drug/metabolite transporter (DMT)-like permease